MATKLSVPSVVALSSEKMDYSTLIFLQAVENSLKTLDNNVIYGDSVTASPVTLAGRSISAQGQAFSISGVTVASGDDYAALVSDVRALLQSHLQLQQKYNDLISQLKGS